MKGKFFSRFLVLVLTLALGLNTSVSTVSVEAKTNTTCKCPYCKLVLKKTGQMIPEGVIVSKKQVAKTVKVTYNGKKTKWTVKQKGKVVKGKQYKFTIIKGDTKKSVTVKVNRITRIYIKQCKLMPVVEGSTFPINSFKKKSIIMADYVKGKSKEISTYTISAAKKVKANSNNEFIVTVKLGDFEDSIAIPVIPATPVATPTTSPATTPPSATPVATPTASPTTTPPSATPVTTPTTSPTTTPPSATPVATPTTSPTTTPPSVTPVATPIIIIITASPQSATPVATPTASPTTTPPSATPMATPTASPTTTPPSATPMATPTASPTKFCQLIIPNAEIVDCVGGTLNETETAATYGSYISIRPKTLTNFSFWQDQNGNLVSKQTILSFYAKGDSVTFIPVYSDSPDTTKTPILRFSGYKLIPENLTVELFLGAEIPDGYERKEWGFVYTNQPLDETSLVLGADVFKVINDATKTSGSAEWTHQISFSQNAWDLKTLVKFRSYSIVLDEEGNESVVYSPILDVTLTSPAE